MKNFRTLSLCLLISGSFTTAALAAGNSPMAAPTSSVVTGEVLEVKDVDSYTYLRLKTSQGETWAAVNKSVVKKGAKVSIENATVMDNFESKTLKKTFPTIVFGNLAGTGAAKDAASAHAGLNKPADAGPIKVAKASGANAHTVAEVVNKAAALKDKPVQVSGKVVKYNAGIMGKNWIHLQDGSGTAADNSNDVLVTSAAPAKLGDVVTASGVVRNNKDFGAGYTYKVLIEDATLKTINK
ncbi:MAG: nucleotide-binding protein [Rhodoferax sp.]|uniref:nucleotide-binding protein n=1 Tax=Rhodoferax sp. TaxID=50421 RepID=UPI00260FCC24|nr:nucleotide-binding protein [Rhodoferax sp.]MDD2878898.1 nucleotide-binding protein [Rhodoferax sp.]